MNLDSTAQAVTINATVVPIEGRTLEEAEGSVRTISPTVTTSTLTDGASEEITLTRQPSLASSSRSLRPMPLGSSSTPTWRQEQQTQVAFQGTEPLAGSGVLLEVITTGEQTLEINPSVLYANTEQGAAGELYLKVTNLSGLMPRSA